MTQQKSALGALHLSAFLMGATGVFSKVINLPAWDITGYRTLIAVFFLFAWVAWREKNIFLNTANDYLKMLILGVLLGIHWITFFYSMQISNIAVGMLSLYIYPVITVFLEPLVKKTQLDLVDVLCAFSVFTGIYFLVPAFDLNNSVTQGVLWGLLSALTFAIRNLFFGVWFAGQSAAKSLSYQVLVIACIMLPFVIHSTYSPTTKDWWLLAFLGIGFTAITHALLGYALRFLKAKTVALVACMQPVWGITFGIIFVSAIPNISTIFGGLIIVITALFESLRQHHKRTKA